MTVLVKDVDYMADEGENGHQGQRPDLPSVVAAAHRALTAALISELAQRGFADLSPAYAAILPLIEMDGVRQVALAQRAGLTKQAIGQLVQELQARGYLELVADPRDRRARVVRFTLRGIALRQAGLDAKRDMWAAAAGVIGRQAAERLAHDLHAVADTFVARSEPRPR